jgi:nucleotide-binding universal stress UspA family protein
VGEASIRSRVGISPEKLDEIREVTEREHQTRLDRLLSDVDTKDLELTTHLGHGSAGLLVPQVAGEVGAELIVVGTVGRTGIAGLLIGNTAESIFSQVKCPVLAIKPEGFETPVRYPPASST